MLPYLNLFGLSIPSYWLYGLVGAAFCVALLLFRHKHFRELQQVDITNAAGLAMVGMILGARLLYLLTILPLLLRNRVYLSAHTDLLRDILYNGMVFYGGLFGSLTAIGLYLNKYKLPRRAFGDYIAPCFPLFHAFGRLGCFFTGCCHGKPSAVLGLVFPQSIGGPSDIPLFPLQLVGSFCELLLCLLVLAFERRHRGKGWALPFYLTLYGAGRFVYEFFRGDSVRGIFLGLSTSQWISLALLALLAFCCMKRRKKGEKTLKMQEKL